MTPSPVLLSVANMPRIARTRDRAEIAWIGRKPGRVPLAALSVRLGRQASGRKLRADGTIRRHAPIAVTYSIYAYGPLIDVCIANARSFARKLIRISQSEDNDDV